MYTNTKYNANTKYKMLLLVESLQMQCNATIMITHNVNFKTISSVYIIISEDANELQMVVFFLSLISLQLVLYISFY